MLHTMLYMGLINMYCILISCTVYDEMIPVLEHSNDYVTFPISPTTLIISLTHGLLPTKVVYVLENMDVCKVLPYIFINC